MEPQAVITFRIDTATKKAFDDACKTNDVTPSQVLRAAIRDYLAKTAQGDLLRGAK